MSRVAAALCVLLLSNAAIQAQPSRTSTSRGKVHRMEIINGMSQNVRYFGSALTPSESSTLRELERLENESSYANNLVALKQQYVNSERILETHRRMVQLQLYGVDVTQANYMPALAYGSGYYGNYVRQGLTPAYTYGYYGGPVVGLGGASQSVNYSLANGMGNEGVVKDALARVIAQQATPEYAANLDRAYERATMLASASPALRDGLNMPSLTESRRERSRIRTVADESDPVVVTLKSGTKIYGKSIKKEKDWAIVERADGRRHHVRLSEVVQIDETPSGGIRFSAD